MRATVHGRDGHIAGRRLADRESCEIDSGSVCGSRRRGRDAPRTTDEDLPTLMRRVYLAYYQEYFDMMQALDVDFQANPGLRHHFASIYVDANHEMQCMIQLAECLRHDEDAERGALLYGEFMRGWDRSAARPNMRQVVDNVLYPAEHRLLNERAAAAASQTKAPVTDPPLTQGSTSTPQAPVRP